MPYRRRSGPFKKDYTAQQLLAIALRYVGRRMRTIQEVRTYLAERQLTPNGTLVEEAVQRLIDMKALDDAAYTEAFLGSRLRYSPKSVRLLTQKLKQKGVHDDDITRGKAKLDSELGSDELALARQAIGSRSAKYSTLPYQVCGRRLGSFLVRRGFSSQTVRRLVDEYCGKNVQYGYNSPVLEAEND